MRSTLSGVYKYLICSGFIIALSFFNGTLSASPLQNMDSVFNLPLEELLKIKISVTSKSSESSREAVNIVSVITQKDIELNHCRDLVDVINMIPGLNLSKDDDYTTFTSRGLYGFEGRTLIMVDGMQLSDLYFGSYVIGNDFPIHLVERIEVIRGPGSVMYGGAAELTVINIVTLKGENIDGISINARYGQLTNTPGHADVGLVGGKSYKNISYSILATYGEARRTDASAAYVGLDTRFKHNKESAGLSNGSIVGNIRVKDKTEIKLIYNRYTNNQVRRFSVIPDSANPGSQIYPSIEEGIAARKVNYIYTTGGAGVNHIFQVSDILSLVPGINYQYSYPYQRTPDREEVFTQRLKPTLHGLFEWSATELIIGGEYFGDFSIVHRPDEVNKIDYLRKFIDDKGRDQLLISNAAAYARFKHGFKFRRSDLYLVAGLRYDVNELYGSRFNPKLGLSFVHKKINSKILYSSAFRAPLVGNNAFSRYGLNPDTALYTRNRNGVGAEYTNIIELEFGMIPTENLYLQLNAYKQWVNEIIEFRYNYMNGDLYSDNGGKISTAGVEAEVKYVSEFYKGLINFSYIKPYFTDDVNPWAYSYNNPKGGDTYITPDNENGYPTRLELLSVPSIKVYTNQTTFLTEQIAFSANALFVDNRYAYNGSGTSKLLNAQIIVGAGLLFSQVLPGLSLQVSIHDIFNEYLNIATAWYDGGYDVLPYKGREISISASYHF